MLFVHICTHVFCHYHVFTLFYDIIIYVCYIHTLLNTVACWVANMLHAIQRKPCPYTSCPPFQLGTCTWLWQCPLPVSSSCVKGGSSPASQEGLGQLWGAAQLTTSQLSFAPLQSLVHHYMHHCTECAGGQDSVDSSDRMTDNTVTVTVSCGQGLASV